jgi:predicted aminopeptidase
MGKSTTIILAAVGLGGLGYFLYKKGLFSNTITETKLVSPTPPLIPTIPIVVKPDDSAAIAAAKKAKELADAELAKLQDESLKMKIAIEVEKARLAKLLNDINAEAAVREAATAEAQRIRLAQLEAERQAAMESENVRLGRIEYERLQAAKLALIERARVREAILEAERLEAERLLNNNTPIKTTYPIKE